MEPHLLPISNSDLNVPPMVHLVTLCGIHLIFLILKAHKDEREGENVVLILHLITDFWQGEGLRSP